MRETGDDTLLVVDAITGLGTTHLDVDGWGVDVIIGGSQKALMIPPGLAYCAISERAWKRMETTTSPRFYFDLRKERKVRGQGRIRVHACDFAVRRIGSGAWNSFAHMGNGDLAKGTRGAGRQCRTLRGNDTRGGAGFGIEAVRSSLPPPR